MRTRFFPLLATGLLPLLVLACQKDDIRAFPAAKEAGGPGVPAPAAARPEIVTWTLPSGWEERPGEGMRFATLVVGLPAGQEPVEVRVTPLNLTAQDPLANVNRWREQIGLAHIGPQELSEFARSVEIAGRQAHRVDITGAAEGDQQPPRILGAILPGDERAWFFLVMDDAARVSQVAASFDTFMESVEIQAAAVAADLPPGHPPLDGSPSPDMDQPPASQVLRWTTPEGWRERQETNPSRLATLDVQAGSSQAEVSITRFPGDVGGVLANVNRWRDQLGLAPVQDLAGLEPPLQELDVDGSPAQFLDLAGSAAAGAEAQGMLVVLVSREDFTYFVKMTGPVTLLQQQRDPFVQFARSIRFERPHS